MQRSFSAIPWKSLAVTSTSIILFQRLPNPLSRTIKSLDSLLLEIIRHPNFHPYI